jgi:hypothetical protein
LDRLNTYNFTIDDRNYDLWETNFTDDCYLDMGHDTHRGRHQLGKWMASNLESVKSGVHLGSNFVVELVLQDNEDHIRHVRVKSKLHVGNTLTGES